MTHGANVDEREYGELIATVRHLSGVVEALQKQYSQDTAKLHARLDEMLRTMTPKNEHDRLVDRVDKLHSFASETRTRVDKLDGGKDWSEWATRLPIAAGMSILAAAAGAILTAALM